MSLRAAAPLYQHRGLALTVQPTGEPVADTELWLHLNSDQASFPDAKSYITDARQDIEQRTGIAFLTQTWRLALDRWPTGGEGWWDGVRQGAVSDLYGASQKSVELPRWPLQSISGINTYDDGGNATAVTVASTFDVDLYRVPGRMTLKGGAVWPIGLRSSNAIEITFVAGYTSAANVPGPLKRAVKQLAAYYFSHRGDECDPKDAYVASGAESIVSRYRAARI